MASMNMNYVRVVNRTHEMLHGTFDGIPIDLPPGYRLENGKPVPAGPHGEVAFRHLPANAAERVKWQNPQMGTADPESPNDMDFKVGVIEWDDDISFLPDTDAIELIDRDLLDDDARTATKVQTRAGRKAKRKNRRSQPMMVDPKLKDTVLKTAVDYND